MPNAFGCSIFLARPARFLRNQFRDSNLWIVTAPRALARRTCCQPAPCLRITTRPPRTDPKRHSKVRRRKDLWRGVVIRPHVDAGQHSCSVGQPTAVQTALCLCIARRNRVRRRSRPRLAVLGPSDAVEIGRLGNFCLNSAAPPIRKTRRTGIPGKTVRLYQR